MLMKRFKAAGRLLIPVLFLILCGSAPACAQGLTVENVRTDNFPELRFDVRADENLVANKTRLIVKDNYVPVSSYRIAAGKASGNGGVFVISYTVPDPERLDGTTTFEYRGKSVTTTYLVKKPTPEQQAAYPKEEHTDNTLFYIIGGLGIAAGITGFLLSRRNNRRRAEAGSYEPPAPPASSPVSAPGPAMPPAASSPSPEDAYKPRSQPGPAATGPSRVPETVILPGIMPTLTIRINERSIVLSPNGTVQKIGRAPECDLILPHPTVSKIHASIHFENGNWWIEDLGSTNGTYADGKRVVRAPLYDGSKLYFGQVTGMFNLPH